ncbi:MAG: hypothetical protein K2L83_01965 [Muribaculaceae bacterium]|nr:hypothetical protein [Muribaculaceae bacterium]
MPNRSEGARVWRVEGALKKNAAEGVSTDCCMNFTECKEGEFRSAGLRRGREYP